MTLSEALSQWLSSSRRSYAGGIDLFVRLAPDEMKRRYLLFLQVDHPDALRVNLLYDKLTRLFLTLRSNPASVRLLSQEADLREEPLVTHDTRVLDSNVVSTPAPRHDDGVRVLVAYDSLPDEQRASYDRIREIIPLFAKLHAMLTAVATDAERCRVARDLCALDDERRRLWDDLDRWATHKGVDLPDGKTSSSTASSDRALAGLNMQRRRRRLMDNIRTSRMSAERFRRQGNAVRAADCDERASRYAADLDLLEREIAELESDG